MDMKQDMKLFIWKDVEGVTSREHNSGGVAVVAATVEEARALIKQHPQREYKSRGPDVVRPADPPGVPDAVYNLLGHYDRKVFVFPNAGCC